MEVYEKIEKLESLRKGWVLTIGNFDGVHLGHRQIIATAKEAAKRLGAPGVAVMTFDPHPVSLLRPGNGPGVLTPIPMRKHLLEDCGVDILIVLKDSMDLLNLSPEEFVDNFLMKTLKPSAVIEGPNFSFGYGRSGDVNTLRDFSKTRNFEVIEVMPQRLHTWGEKPVMYSSTLIRNSLDRGDVVTAAAAMGRHYRLVGKTITGRGIGKELGYPTANLDITEQVIPAEAVYAGFVGVSDSFEEICKAPARMPAAFSVGRAKTFVTDHPLLVEAHVLGENLGDIYGKWLAMDFVRLLRNQQRFENDEKLSEQIQVDCRIAKEVLSVERRKRPGSGV